MQHFQRQDRPERKGNVTLTHIVGSDVAVVHGRSGRGVNASARNAVVGRRLYKLRESVRVVQVVREAARMVDLVEKTHVCELHTTTHTERLNHTVTRCAACAGLAPRGRVERRQPSVT